MRSLGSEDFAGRVTFITGPGRASGKTSLLLAALTMLRRSGEEAALLGIGFEGVAKGLGSPQGRATRLRVEAGELFASTASWLEGCGASPEILGLLSGSGAFGRLALARARRPGDVVLVGPESNEATAEAVALMREVGAATVLVDGAFGRLTQVAAIEGARFFSSAIVDRGNLASVAASMRRMAALGALPLYDEQASGEGAEFIFLDGPLTAGIVAALPDRPVLLVVEDFTKVFLEEAALRSLLSRHAQRVRRRIEFAGFVVARRGVGAGEVEGLAEACGAGELLFASPYEDGGAAHAA